MSASVKALLFVLLLAACTPESTAVARAPGPSAQPVGSTVPPNGWRAVLIAGDNDSPAFDNGVEAMRDLIEKGTPAEAHPTQWGPFVVVGEGAE